MWTRFVVVYSEGIDFVVFSWHSFREAHFLVCFLVGAGENEREGHSTTRPNARERSFQRTITAITNPLSMQRQRDALISLAWRHKR